MGRRGWSAVRRDDLKALVSFIKADSLGYARPSDCAFSIGLSNDGTSRNPAGRFRNTKAVRIGSCWSEITGLSLGACRT